MLKFFIYPFQALILVLNFFYVKSSYLDYLNFARNNTKLTHSKIQFFENNNFNQTGNLLECKATKNIKANEILFNIPKEYLICSFDYFPYKLEIKEAIQDYFKNRKNSYINNNLTTTNKILFSYNLMYLFYQNKTELHELMVKSKHNSYIVKPTSQIQEYLDSIKNNFIPHALNKDTYEENDQKLFELFSNNFIKEENVNLEIFDHVIEYINKKIIRLDKNILPWINDKNLFIFVNSLITERSFLLNLNKYEIVHNKSLLYMQMGYRQKEKLEDIHNLDGLCLIPLIDACERKFNKNEQDLVEYQLIASANKIRLILNKNIKKGNHVYYMNNYNLPNEELFKKYGFYVKNNNYSSSYFLFNLNKQNFTFDKNRICAALNCFDTPLDMYYENQLLNEVNLIVPAFKNYINKRILNALRLFVLENEQLINNEINIFTSLSKGQLLNYYNELLALAKYRQNIIESAIQGSKFKLKDILYSIYNTKIYYKQNLDKYNKDLNLLNRYKIRKGLIEIAREEKLILQQNVYMTQNEIKKLMSDQFNKIRNFYIAEKDN